MGLPVPRLKICAWGLLLAAARLEAGGLELTVEPEAGPLDSVFKITLTNHGAADAGAGEAPAITSLNGGRSVYCPTICDDCVKTIPPGGSLQALWKPGDAGCGGWLGEPGLYEVRWQEAPDLSARLELLPAAAFQLTLQVEPPGARFGDPLRLIALNETDQTVVYNQCCYPPLILDPLGRSVLCTICPDCILEKDFVPHEKLAFDWTPGEPSCGDGPEELPGLYRIIWGGFWDGGTLHGGNPFFAETTLKVLPRMDRRLELSLSTDRLRAGETLTLSATNPLDVSVWQDPCCDRPIFIDSLGRQDPCEPCRLKCAAGRRVEIPPGGTVTMDFVVPDPLPCGLEPGSWSVIWGRNFGLTPGTDPTPLIFGYGELEVLAGPTAPAFIRGDCDSSGALDITDAVGLLGYLFLAGARPACLDACDGDDSSQLDLSDAVLVLNYLFLGGPAPALPFPVPGADPTPDALGCGP
jgi:hypothetical protein